MQKFVRDVLKSQLTHRTFSFAINDKFYESTPPKSLPIKPALKPHLHEKDTKEKVQEDWGSNVLT